MDRGPRWPRARPALGWACAGLLLFGLTTLDTVLRGPMASHVIALHSHVSAWRDAGFPTRELGRVLAYLGHWWVVAPIVVLGATACLLLGSPRRALVLVLTAVAAGAITMLMQATMTGFNVPLPVPAGPAPGGVGAFYAERRHLFPSGHTIGGSLQLGLTVLLVAEAWIDGMVLRVDRALALRQGAITLALGLAFLAGIGRVLLQVHWFTDVLAGWGFSLAVVGLALLAARPHRV